MDGLRSTRRRTLKAGVFFCLFLSLASPFPLPGEEPPDSQASEEEASPAEQASNEQASTESPTAGQDSGVASETASPPPALDVDALRRRITEEAPGELVNLSLGDSAVSLNMSGRWKGTLEGSWGVALTPLGASAVTGDTPLFTQEGDLTLSLWIRDRWFVEASFMDDSTLNTYRAGYQGLDGEAVRYVGVGNTGLDFPAFPYLDLGGDSPSSFGAYGHFGVGNLELHSLVRYDAAAREERIFVGDRERSYIYADLSRPQRGSSFVLPDDNLNSVPEVYIQDNKGDLRDSEGRRWRLAESSEYGVSARYGLLELSLGTYTGGAAEPDGMVAVYYPGPYSLGSYSGPAGTFLADVQDYFDSIDPSVHLIDYPQAGQGNAGVLGTSANVPGTVSIDGTTALVIYEPGAFSPFEKQSRYLAPVNTSSQADLVKLSTGNSISGYEVIPLDDTSMDVVIQETDQNRLIRPLYELVRDGARDRRSPADRWPLGDSCPDLYLPGRAVFTEDMGIRFTNYSTAGAYFIGTDVVPGSVQVYRNGIQDPNFVYNSSGGIVTLGNPAGFSEVVRVTYLKQSSERRLGSLAAGIGAIWAPEGAFSGKLGLGVRWNVTSEAYSENGAASPGTVGLGAEAKWDYDRLKAGLTLGLGFEQPDTTGLYRAAGMEGSEIILSLPPGNSFISETPASVPPASYTAGERAPLVYRNYRETSLLGGATLSDISSGAPVVSGETGPYPANDKAFSSQVLTAEFELSSERTWTGFETPLGANGDFLERAGKIEVPYRFMDFSRNPSVDPLAPEVSVILQIGALADKDTGNPENPNLVMEKRLYPPEISEDSNPVDFDENGRIATLMLSDDDRVKLQGAKYLRLLVVFSGTSNIQGRVVMAPPIVRGALWRPITAADNEISPARGSGPDVNVYEEVDPALGRKYSSVIDRLHSESSRQRVLEISWNDFSGSFVNSGPGADGRIPAVPLTNYRSLSFFVRRPRAAAYDPGFDDNDPVNNPDQFKLNQGTLRFILARGPSSLKNQGEIALDAAIPIAAIIDSGVKPGEWTRVDIQYRGGSSRVLVGGKSAAGSSVTFRSAAAALFSGDNNGAVNTGLGTGQGDERSTYAAFLLVPETGVSYPEGNMAVDEIILEDPVPSYRLNGGATVEYNLPGTVLGIGDRPVISDLSFQAALESGAQGNPFVDSMGTSSQGAMGSFGMNGRTQTGFSLLGLKIAGNYSYSLNTSQGINTDYAWAAGHSLSRAFGPFSIQESFDDAPADRTMNHRLGLDLRTRVRGNILGETLYDNATLSRRWQAGTGGKPAEKVPLDFSLDARAAVNKKTGSGAYDGSGTTWEGPDLSNYAGAWLNSFGDLLPDSGSGAEGRDLGGSFRIRLDTSPLATELYFQGTSSFSRPLGTSQAISLARLDFPFNPGGGDLRMLFRTEREYRRDLSGESRNFREDGNIWAGSFGDALPLMFSVPFYSLFDPRMGKRMDEFGSLSSGATQANSGADLSQFADRFEFSLQRPMNYGLSSFFLPRRFTFRLGRVLERKLDTPRDTLNLGAGLNFSSVNMFGAMGVFPVFSFYRGDEFSHSLDSQIAFPKGETVSWSIRSDEAAFFHGFAGAELTLNNTLTVNSSTRIGEGSRWTDNLSAAWTAPAEKSLLGTLYAAFTRMARGQGSWLTLANLAESEYEQLRKETLEFIFEKVPDVTEGDYVRFSLALGHESIVRIFGRLNLSVYGKLTISQDYNTRVFSFMGTIGTTLNLMF